jgi:hypothetical protein
MLAIAGIKGSLASRGRSHLRPLAARGAGIAGGLLIEAY